MIGVTLWREVLSLYSVLAGYMIFNDRFSILSMRCFCSLDSIENHHGQKYRMMGLMQEI